MRHTRRIHRTPATATTNRPAPSPGPVRPLCERRRRHFRFTGFENPGDERSDTPRQLPMQLLVMRRWIEQQHDGPRHPRYRVSEVEAWLRERDPMREGD